MVVRKMKPAREKVTTTPATPSAIAAASATRWPRLRLASASPTARATAMFRVSATSFGLEVRALRYPWTRAPTRSPERYSFTTVTAGTEEPSVRSQSIPRRRSAVTRMFAMSKNTINDFPNRASRDCTLPSIQ